jgi:hypothetical protein
VGVEAKADERFGTHALGDYLSSSRANTRSRVPERIRSLTAAQLVHALAATLIEASSREADQAVFVIHEFLSRPDRELGWKGTSAYRASRNQSDFESFTVALPGGTRPVAGQLMGPFRSPGAGRVPENMTFLGKASVTVEPWS